MRMEKELFSFSTCVLRKLKIILVLPFDIVTNCKCTVIMELLSSKHILRRSLSNALLILTFVLHRIFSRFSTEMLTFMILIIILT